MDSQLRIDIAAAVLFAAVLYSQVSRSNQQTVLSLILITMWAAALIGYVGYRYKLQRGINAKSLGSITADVVARNMAPANSTSYFVKRFPKGITHLVRNEVLTKIAKDLYFTRVFDKGRYQDIVMLLEKFQRTYMYILGGRYEPVSYIPAMVDVSDLVLEHIYSLYIVVPKQTKHMYGLDTHETLSQCIEQFTSLRRKMLDVVNKYKIKLLDVNFVDPSAQLPRAADAPFSPESARRLGA
jgi:hypothetical protein